MTHKPFPQPVLLRLSDVSDVGTSTAHRTAYVTTTLPAIVQGLRNLECQPDPFNEFQGPDALFTRLLAVIVGTTEYDAVMGNDVERLNALLAEQVERVATLTRERDEARDTLSLVHSQLTRAWKNGTLPADVIPAETARHIAVELLTTPTPGAQA